MPYVYDSAPHSRDNHRDVITDAEVEHWHTHGVKMTGQTRVWCENWNRPGTEPLDKPGWEIAEILPKGHVSIIAPYSGNLRFYCWEAGK